MNSNLAPCVSILGTGSDVGKSIVAAALCRIFRDEGFKVAPFKAQNMSNNSSVTHEGGEMGRAQVVQAQAAGITPHVDMNPVLLKPSSNVGSQVILQGKPLYNVSARDYFRNTDELFQKSRESLERLRKRYELIVIEGAGSCGEVNLMQRDFVNFKTAQAADAPVILVADIDRGGVFAQLIGTLAVIPEKHRNQVKGFIINRFRGDPTLFDEGITYLEEKTGLPVLGLVPFFDHIKIDSEDSVLLECLVDPKEGPTPGKANIAVLRFPHISNFTDFLPLENDSQVNLHYLQQPRSLVDYDIVLLPGSKNVRSDLRWLKSGGWDRRLREYSAGGGEIGGICGGYQILGSSISDPQGVEDLKGEDVGLGMLPLKTIMNPQKTLSRSVGRWIDSGDPIEGYEIHMGQTELTGDLDSLIQLQSRNNEATAECDGAISKDGKVWGTYFHGLFDNKPFRQRFLKRLYSNYQPDHGQPDLPISEFRNQQYDLLAAHFRKHVNIEKTKSIIGI